MVPKLDVCHHHGPLVYLDHFGDRQPKYASREQGDLALNCRHPRFWFPSLPHVWGAAFVQKRDGSVGKYGVHEVP